VLSQLAQGGDFTHVLSNVKIGFACNWATSSACSTLDTFKKLMLLSEFLGIHAIHHFYVKKEHKVIKAFSRESPESNHPKGDFPDGEEIA
jgi:hypothetical protein